MPYSRRTVNSDGLSMQSDSILRDDMPSPETWSSRESNDIAQCVPDKEGCRLTVRPFVARPLLDFPDKDSCCHTAEGASAPMGSE
jgi:hypothetical protein